MPDHNSGFREERAQFVRDSINVDNPVVQVEDLPLAINFALDGIADDPLVILRDNRLDRQTVLRRSFNRAHVARAGQSQMKRARDRCGTECENIDQLPQQLEALFVQNAKTLLFIDHNQPKILECNIALHQPMCADHDVDISRSQPLHHLLLLPCRPVARKQLDANRVIGHSFSKRHSELPCPPLRMSSFTGGSPIMPVSSPLSQ